MATVLTAGRRPTPDARSTADLMISRRDADAASGLTSRRLPPPPPLLVSRLESLAHVQPAFWSPCRFVLQYKYQTCRTVMHCKTIVIRCCLVSEGWSFGT